MKTFASVLLGLVAATSAVDYQYWTGVRCTGDSVGSGTFACGKNYLPVSPAILGINLLYANGYQAMFYHSSDCSGNPWFIDDGTGGCVTDSTAQTNCIYIPC
jgi:hypothetical protein